jgi:hypothetical protein
VLHVSRKVISGYKGIEGNEKADYLVKKAAKSFKPAFINGYSLFLYISKGLKGRTDKTIIPIIIILIIPK